jgi:hypothetical protein
MQIGDPAIAKIPCDGAGQGADRPFGRRVHGPHRAGEIGCCRRYIDDPAPILQTAKAVLDNEQRRLHIHREEAIEIILRDLTHPTIDNLPGIVDEDVQPVGMFVECLPKGLGCVRHREV